MVSFSCEKAVLQSAITVTSRAVPSKSSIPALEGLLLHAGNGVTVSGYNMNTGIRTVLPADVADSGEFVLNARLLGDIVRRMPDDVITVSADEHGQARLRCGDADFGIAGLDPADFPELPAVEEENAVSVRQDLFRDMIEQTAFAVSTNESRPVHTGVLFEIADGALTMVAVDGFRLALRREPIESAAGAFSFITPGAALNEVKNICSDTDDPVSITLGKRHILFEIGDTELICRRLEGEFLDYRKAIPRGQPVQVTADTRELIDSIDRVSVVVSEKLKAPVRCRFGENRLLLSARTAIGEAKDVCRTGGDGKELEIGFNNRYLLDALRRAPADAVRIELGTSISPAVLVPAESENENFLYMILPVRLKADGA